ncbi:MAG: NeuD/PglB/VioB family sugar acetyltransferase [Phycisphaerales bacterium]
MTQLSPVPIVLIGGGGHALVVADAAVAAGRVVRGCYDDAPQPTVCAKLSITRLGSLADLAAGDRWVLALGSIEARRKFIAARGDKAETIVHPLSTISATARLGAGVFVGPRAVVHTCASVGDHCIVNTGAIVEHECELGANVHLAPGAILAGNVTVGEDTLIGLGARVLPGVKVGRRCIVGAGAVVLADVPDGATVIGVPARKR